MTRYFRVVTLVFCTVEWLDERRVMDWRECKRGGFVACREVLFLDFPSRIEKSRNLGRNFRSVPDSNQFPSKWKLCHLSQVTGCRRSMINSFTAASRVVKTDSMSTLSRVEGMELRYCEISYVPLSDSALLYWTPCILFFLFSSSVVSTPSSMFWRFNMAVECCLYWKYSFRNIANISACWLWVLLFLQTSNHSSDDKTSDVSSSANRRFTTFRTIAGNTRRIKQPTKQMAKERAKPTCMAIVVIHLGEWGVGYCS